MQVSYNFDNTHIDLKWPQRYIQILKLNEQIVLINMMFKPGSQEISELKRKQSQIRNLRAEYKEFISFLSIKRSGISEAI